MGTRLAIVVRAMFEDTWLYDGHALYVRDQWMRDTQIAMNQPAAHGRFVHIYLDGLYWGVYNLLERLDDHFAASHFGGTEADYDIADRIAFDASATNTAMGRFATSMGVHFTTLSRTTFGVDNPSNVQQFRTGAGAANAYPLAGPVVIHDWICQLSNCRKKIRIRNSDESSAPPGARRYLSASVRSRHRRRGQTKPWSPS